MSSRSSGGRRRRRRSTKCVISWLVASAGLETGLAANFHERSRSVHDRTGLARRRRGCAHRDVMCSCMGMDHVRCYMVRR